MGLGVLNARGHAGTRGAARARALVAVGVVVAAVSTWAELVMPGRPPHGLVELRAAAGMSLIVVGVLARSRRPDSRVGALMWAAGITWFAIDLHLVHRPGTAAAGALGGALEFALLAHLLLAFPDGHLRGRSDRAVTAVAYGCSLLAATLPVIGTAAGAGVAVATLAVLVRRWSAASPPRRRALAPVSWIGGPVVAALAAARTITEFSPASRLGTVLAFVSSGALMAVPFSVLVGMVRANLARMTAGRLALELGDAPPSDRLRDVLARTVHDPSLEVLYHLDDSGGFVDRDGRSALLPPPGGDRATTLLRRQGRPVAALVHDPSLRDDPGLLETVAATASLAIENERLEAAVRARLAEVRASRARIVAAADAARRRIERDLHDGAQQRLVKVAMDLRMARDQAHAAACGPLGDTLDRTAEELSRAVAELRDLAAGIHPAVLSDGGLGPAVTAIAERSAVPLDIACADHERLAEEIEAAAYFVVSEAVANVAKHAGAERASVRVARREGWLVVEVSDDGCGGADAQRGSGLRGLADRVAALDGRLVVQSPPGAGTRVLAELPCA